eukprot:gene5571-4205_t
MIAATNTNAFTRGSRLQQRSIAPPPPGGRSPCSRLVLRSRARSVSVVAATGKIVVFGGSGGCGSETIYQALEQGYDVTTLVRTPSKVVVPPGSGGGSAGQPFNNPKLTVVQGDVTNAADVAKGDVTNAADVAKVITKDTKAVLVALVQSSPRTRKAVLVALVITKDTKAVLVALGHHQGHQAMLGALVITKDTKLHHQGHQAVLVALGGKTKDVGATMLTVGTNNVIEAMNANGVKRVAVVTSIGCGDSSKQAPIVFKNIFNDKNNQEALFLNGPGKGLEYTIVRPGGLTATAPAGLVNVIEGEEGSVDRVVNVIEGEEGSVDRVVNVIEGEAGSIARADVASFCMGAMLDPDFPYLRKTPCISSVGGTSWTKDRGDKGMMEA